MNKEFVPYEQALVLKELGFDEPCFRWYDERWGDDLQQDKFNTNKDLFMTDLDCSAPLYQQAFRFFKEKYQMVFGHWPSLIKDLTYIFFIYIEVTGEKVRVIESKYDEEAELHCLKKLIEIVKNK